MSLRILEVQQMEKDKLYINHRILTKDIINHKFRDQLFEQGHKLKFTHIFNASGLIHCFLYSISIIPQVQNFACYKHVSVVVHSLQKISCYCSHKTPWDSAPPGRSLLLFVITANTKVICSLFPEICQQELESNFDLKK